MPEEKKKNGESLFANMPFLDHLEELRWRVLKSAIAVVVMAMVAFYFSDQIFAFIKKPLGDVKLYNIAVTGTMYAYLKIAIFVGIAAALPVVFYQLWSFVSPGLYRREKRAVLPLVSVSTALFLAGAAFCYYLVLPFALNFFVEFGDGMVTNTITIGSYISFVGALELAFGACFQLPVIAYFLAKIGIINARLLSKGRRYAIVIILIVAAILTPTPDVFTQMLLAVPLYALYEISIIVVRITQARRRARQEAVAAVETDDRDRLPYDPAE